MPLISLLHLAYGQMVRRSPCRMDTVSSADLRLRIDTYSTSGIPHLAAANSFICASTSTYYLGSDHTLYIITPLTPRDVSGVVSIPSDPVQVGEKPSIVILSRSTSLACALCDQSCSGDQIFVRTNASGIVEYTRDSSGKSWNITQMPSI